MNPPPKNLEEAIERLRIRNEALDAHLKGKTGLSTTPEVSLVDATAKAKKFWDEREELSRLGGRNRASVRPKP